MLSIIVAVAENNIIGGDNKLLWHISEDLKRFRNLTTDHTIIMGRKTFESLPKILPNRHHVILTNDKNYSVNSEDVTIVNTLNEILDTYSKSAEEAFIIGGGQIYNLLLPYCSKIYLTKIKKAFEGDTYFPKINFNDFEVVYSSEENIHTENNLFYQFIDLVRK